MLQDWNLRGQRSAVLIRGPVQRDIPRELATFRQRQAGVTLANRLALVKREAGHRDFDAVAVARVVIHGLGNLGFHRASFATDFNSGHGKQTGERDAKQSGMAGLEESEAGSFVKHGVE